MISVFVRHYSLALTNWPVDAYGWIKKIHECVLSICRPVGVNEVSVCNVFCQCLVAVGHLAKVANTHNITLVHVSSDYVFDGTQELHSENEAFSPLSVYGASKAAGDAIVGTTTKHYLLRTSWVIGEGNNFVRTMLGLGQKGINPTVVSDQIGRLTFTSELVEAIDFLLHKEAPFGTYNVSNSGDAASWSEITRKIYEESGLSNTVTDTTTEEYYAGKTNIALRPLKSSLDLTKIQSLGFKSQDWKDALSNYIQKEQAA